MSYKELNPFEFSRRIEDIAKKAHEELEPFFNPKAIAVIGASRDPWTVGWVVFKTLLEKHRSGKLKAKVYGVNIKGGELFGEKLYKSILDVPDDVDHGVIVVPAKFVPGVVEECGKKGVKVLSIISAGFSEIGNVELEKQVVENAKKYGIRIVGPNGLGIFDNYTGVDMLFVPEYKKYNGKDILATPRPKPGSILFGSQSGALGIAILDALYGADIGIAKFVSYGNKVDVDETDMILWAMTDEIVDVVMFYIEGIKRAGRHFVEAGRYLSRIKPIVVLKGGRTAAGARAAASHTGSLAGDYKMYEAAFKKMGAIVVETLEELIDTVKAFTMQPPAPGYRVTIITDGGGAGLLATDASERYGLKVLPPSEKFLARLKEGVKKGVLLPIATFSNPIDVTGSGTDGSFAYSLEAALDDENTDAIMIIGLHHVPELTDKLPERLLEVINEKQIAKPIVFVDVGGADYAIKFRAKFEKAGIPAYPTPERAAAVLKKLADYGAWLKKMGTYEKYIERWKKKKWRS